MLSNIQTMPERDRNLLRFGIDTLTHIVSFAIALVVSGFLLIITEKSTTPFGQILGFLWNDSSMTIAVGLVVIGLSMYLFRIYGMARSYKIKKKILVICQAVTVAYLILAVLNYMFPSMFNMNRYVLYIAWGTNLSLVLLSRTAIEFVKWILNEPNGRKMRTFVSGNENVVVIGGAGYVGSFLLKKLLDMGYKVRVLDLMLYGEKPIEDVMKHPNLSIVRGDYRHIDQLVNIMRGANTVIHLGGIVGDPACSLDESLTIDVNLTSTRMIAEVAKGHGVKRMIFASSCSVYGASDELLDESSSLNPVSLYAKSKIASERVLEQLADENFSPVFMRFGTIYGLSGRTRFDLVVNLLSAKALIDGEITVFGPDQWRPFVHVDDVSNAIMKVMSARTEDIHVQAFNVGSNAQNYTIGEIGNMIHKKAPDAKLIVKETDGDRRNYRVSFDKIQNVLGFTPQWTLEAGIDQVMTRIKSGEVTNYTDALYSNVKGMKTADGNGLVMELHYHGGWEREYLDAANDARKKPYLKMV